MAISICFVGGDAGGVAGVRGCVESAGPGEQYGICLFGMAVDFSFDVSRLKAELIGGGGLRDCRNGDCWTTKVAMLRSRAPNMLMRVQIQK